MLAVMQPLEAAKAYASPGSGSDINLLTDYASAAPNAQAGAAKPARAIYVGGTGNITVKFGQGQAVTYLAVPAGTVLPAPGMPGNFTAIVAATTTATNLVVHW